MEEADSDGESQSVRSLSSTSPYSQYNGGLLLCSINATFHNNIEDLFQHMQRHKLESIAVILVSKTEHFTQNTEFQFPSDRQFPDIDVCTMSKVDADKIKDICKTEKQKCSCQINDTSMDRQITMSTCNRKDILLQLLFSDTFIVSENKYVFKELSRMVSAEDYTRICKLEIMKKDFLLIFHIVGYYACHMPEKTENENFPKILDYMGTVSEEQLRSSVISFYKRGDFQVTMLESHISVFHYLHFIVTKMTTRYVDAKKTLKNEEIDFFMKWTTVALKFKCSFVNCHIHHQPIEEWTEIFKYVDLSEDSIKRIASGIEFGMQFELPFCDTFIGCGSIEKLHELEHLSFDKLRFIQASFSSYVESSADFEKLFFECSFKNHDRFLKNHGTVKYLQMASGANPSLISNVDITKTGFQYLDSCCAREINVGKHVKLWISHLLTFLSDLNEAKSVIRFFFGSCKKLLETREGFFRDHFIHEIQLLVKNEYGNMTVKDFVTLSKNCKGHLDVQIVVEYFQEYERSVLSHSTALTLNEYSDAICHFSESYVGASNHKFLLDYIIKPLAECYKGRDKPALFIADLIKSKFVTGKLLFGRSDRDVEVVRDFSKFLKSYVGKNARVMNLAVRINSKKAIQDILQSSCEFKKIVLDVLTEVIFNVDNFVNEVTDNEILLLKNACEELDSQLDGSHFYWKIVGNFCEKIIKVDIPLTHKKYGKVLETLSSIHAKVMTLPETYSKHEHLEKFEKMADKIKQNLKQLKQDIKTENITFDQISKIDESDCYANITRIFISEGLEADIAIKKVQFERDHKCASRFLIQNDSTQKVSVTKSVTDILLAYKIVFPHDLIQDIEHFFDINVKSTDHHYQCLPNSTGDDKPLLLVKSGVTLKDLRSIVDRLREFFGNSLINYLSMLGHFHLKNSKVLKLFLGQELRSGTVTTDQLAEALGKLKSNLLKFLTCSKYADLKDMKSYSSLLKKEFEIIVSFEDFRSHYSISIQSAIDFESAIVLHFIVDNVDSLYEFCKIFQLHTCLADNSNLSKLKVLLQENASWEEKEMKAATSIAQKVQTLFRINHLPVQQANFNFLCLFKHLYDGTKQLRNFLYENNFLEKTGQTRFQKLLALLTQQFQQDKFYAEILTKLISVFHLLLKVHKSDITFEELVEIVRNLEPLKCIAQIQTVDSNIALIRMWFDRVEENSVGNALTDLNIIMVNGHFDISVSHNGVNVSLVFGTNTADQTSKNNSLSPMKCHSCPKITWGKNDIQDFIRQLGFVVDDESNNANRESFLNLIEIVKRLEVLLHSLYEMGHPDYISSTVTLHCSNIPIVKSLVSQIKETEEEWSKKTTDSRSNFKWLSFFNNSSVRNLHKLLMSKDEMSVFNYTSFLFHSCCQEEKNEIIVKIKSLMGEIFYNSSPLQVVGCFLDKLFSSTVLQHHLPSFSSSKNEFRDQAVLHQCHEYSSRKLIQYIYYINKYTPKSFEILQCHSEIKQEDIQLFIQRITFFPRHYYIVEINKLSSKLQELFLHHYMGMCGENKSSEILSTIHFIETSSSMLFGAPYIKCVVNGAPPAVKHPVQIKDEVELVYGLQGNGKTHYIKKNLTANSVVIVVNEAFSDTDVIEKLNSLIDKQNCSLHLNVTLVPQEDSDILIDKLNWLMFDLLVLGYVFNRSNGLSFSSASLSSWKIYVEVPAIQNDSDRNLFAFKEYFSTFSLIHSTAKLIDSSIPIDIDEDVQLVCKYLEAMNKEKEKPGWGIDKLFYSDPIKFGDSKDLSKECCYSLLRQYMPNYMENHKITQKLFIKYMKRRCCFLENFPGYNFNQGTGSKPGDDTKKLGSTLMNAMLKEVSQFCDPATRTDWSKHSQNYQQLIYEQQDGGSFGLLCCKQTSELDEINAFKKINVELHQREVLDKYLARALSLPLKAVTQTIHNSGETRYKRLQLVDDMKYVMTLDFALKMINIHERKECGMPVVIEGETGVGKTELLRMLSKLWNYSWEMEWKEQKTQLRELIESLQEKRQIEADKSFCHTISALEESFLGSTDDASEEIKDLNSFLLKLKANPLFSILQIKNTEVNFWQYVEECKEGYFDPKIVFQLVKSIYNADISTFHKLDIHAGLTPADIIKFFDEVEAQAERIKKAFEEHQKQQMENNASIEPTKCSSFYNNLPQVPQIVAYLDEINTSSCMGLFKEIIVDRTIYGRVLSSNIFIVATCNPLRSNSTILLSEVKDAWHKPSYYVRRLHPTMEYLKWNFGALDDIQEKEYISAKMKLFEKDQKTVEQDFTSEELNHLIGESQQKIRAFAAKMFSNIMSVDDAKVCSRSSVSQRDIQRVFEFYNWLCNTYKYFKRFPSEQIRVRATLVSLGLVYYLRLAEKDRMTYAKFLDDECQSLGCVSFTTAFHDELNWHIDKIMLPSGIAKTNALKENILAIIACCQTRTPLIIIGEPGTSKTLSFSLVTNTTPANSEFENKLCFKDLQPFFYQCSQHTNLKEIESLFHQAIDRQKAYDASNLPTYCIVFMDEAGLPEERHESLKVLHYHLDRREVSFVAITNHALDAAKTNRAISLYRPQPSIDDLTILAKDLLCSKTQIQSTDEEKIRNLCLSFKELMSQSKFSSFFGQRDFMHFISYLQRNRKSGFGILNEDLILEALEQNLNGHENTSEVFNFFLAKVDASYEKMPHRNILEIMKASLQDLLSDKHVTDKDEDYSTKIYESFACTENYVRYKLVIDDSEDDSAVRYLLSCGLVDKFNTHMFACSDFHEESGMNIGTIAKIINSMEQGHTVLLFQTEKIHESFYELFNQRFQIIADDDNPKNCLRYTNISIGPHTKPCRLHPKFQCIVVIKKSELHTIPLPFLNRFEKFFLSYGTLYDSVSESMPPNLRIIVHAVFSKVASLINKLDYSRSFYGYSSQQSNDRNMLNAVTSAHHTLCSLLLSLLPLYGKEYSQNLNVQAEEGMDFECKVLFTVLRELQSTAGWNIPQIPVVELQLESKNIFKHLMKHSIYKEAFKIGFDFEGAIGEALDAIHNPNKGVVVHDDACLIISVVVQWLMRYVTMQLIQTLTPEALILNAKHIPNSLIVTYFERQVHFSLKKLIDSLLMNLKREKIWSFKALVYTRKTYLFNYMPQMLKELAGKLYILSVSPNASEGELEQCFLNFFRDKSLSICLVTANMSDVTVKMMNHLRIIIEQQENCCQNLKIQTSHKLIMILVQFPQTQFFDHCYPTLYLRGWSHFYLDSLTTEVGMKSVNRGFQNIVDIEQCFRIALGISNDHNFTLHLKLLLEEAIFVVSSRVITGSSNREYNTKISTRERQRQLEDLLLFEENCTPIGEAICALFAKYWNKITTSKFLQDAARFTFQNKSTLSISTYVQTRIKALFFEFVVYVLHEINQNCNLDLYFSFKQHKKSLQQFFAVAINILSNKLPTLNCLCDNICQNLHSPKNSGFSFPFFIEIFNHLEQILHSCQQKSESEMEEKVEKIVQTFQESGYMTVLKPAIQLLTEVSEMKQIYLEDFLKFKCVSGSLIYNKHATLTEQSSFISKFFNCAKTINPVKFLSHVHVRFEVFKAHLAKIDKLEQMEQFASCCHSAKEMAVEVLENLNLLIIETSYKSLNGIVESEKEDILKEKNVKQWCLLFQDIIQVDNIYSSLIDADPNHRLGFLKAHMLYSLIYCHDCITSGHVKFVISFFSSHIRKIHNTNLEIATADLLQMLHSANFDLVRITISKLLPFVFKFPINCHFIGWFIKSSLPNASLPLMKYLHPFHYRHFLKILLENKEENLCQANKNLPLFRSKVRTIVGETIVSFQNGSDLCEVHFLSRLSKQHDLSTMYLLVVYERLNELMINKKAIIAIKEFENFINKFDSCEDPVEKCLLEIEKEAFLHSFVYLISSILIRQTHGSRELTLDRLPERINGLTRRKHVMADSGLVLCMHLWQSSNSVPSLSDALKLHVSRNLECLNEYNQILIHEVAQAFDPPSWILSFKDKTFQNIYATIRELMDKIHKNKKEPEALKTYIERRKNDYHDLKFPDGNVIKIPFKRVVCMCVWLCAYYQYYMKEITSENLIRGINVDEMDNYWSESITKLMICFLNKNDIEKHPEQSSRGRCDPVFNLFFPKAKQIHMCTAIATMVAVIIACPDSTHLWYHLFFPDELSDTYITGFQMHFEVNKDMPYDCGIGLDEEGFYEKLDYFSRAKKRKLTLHSLYHLLWCNFGSFCVNLLLQSGSAKKLAVLSADISHRHYCVSQLRKFWSLMMTHFQLTEEQLSSFIENSMQRMIKVSYHNDKRLALLYSQHERDEYENKWHEVIFIQSLQETRDTFNRFSVHDGVNKMIWKLKEIQAIYPQTMTVTKFKHYVHDYCFTTERRKQYDVLLTFINWYPHISTGGLLLPSLIKFYQWLITALSGVVDAKEATEINVFEDAVDLATKEYSQESRKHYKKLCEEVEKNCSQYIRQRKFFFETSSMALKNALPGMWDGEYGQLFAIIEDIVEVHNSFLNEIKNSMKMKPSLQKYMPDVSEIHPSAVNDYSCIVGNHNSQDFLMLIHKLQIDQSSFDLDEIEEEIVKHFIVGKTMIGDCKSKLHKIFCYKIVESKNEEKFEDPTRLILKLHPADCISDEFKCEIPHKADFLIALELDLQQLNYEMLMEVGQKLQRITEYVKKKMEDQELEASTIVDCTIGKFLFDLKQPTGVSEFEKLELSHCMCINAVPMKYIFSTFKKVVDWIRDGIYDFHALPKSMKVPLEQKAEEELLNLEYIDKKELLQSLKSIVDILIKCEQYFINCIDHIKENTLIQSIQSILNKEDCKILEILPNTIKPKNYMALRLSLRRQINKLNEENEPTTEEDSPGWFEYVNDLWSENGLSHLRDACEPLDFDQVYNPATELYGFQIGEEDMQHETEETEILEKEDKTEEGHLDTQPSDKLSRSSVEAFATTLKPKDIGEYLMTLEIEDLEKCKALFLAFGVDGSIMINITDDDLVDIGITFKTDRFKIRKKFRPWLTSKHNSNM